MFLEGSHWNGWMDRQQEVVPKRQSTRVKSSCTCVGLDPRDWRTIILVWSQWMGWEWWGEHGVKINRLFFTQGFVGQSMDPEQYSKPCWQPMKRMKQENTAGKWRRLCLQAGQSILNMLKPCEVNVGDTIQKWIAIIEMTENTEIWQRNHCSVQVNEGHFTYHWELALWLGGRVVQKLTPSSSVNVACTDSKWKKICLKPVTTMLSKIP